MIELKDFSKSYKKLSVLTNTTTTIRTDKITFLMGPNGCGKTTLLKCIAGLEGYKGTISYNGEDIDGIRKDMLIIWDDCPFYDDLTGLDNLLILSEKSNIKRKEILDTSTKYFTKEILLRKVKTYSYGQRKKLSLILYRLLNPQILIMDEISNGLDYDTMKLLQGEIKEISKEKNIILTGHQFSFYEGLVEEVLIIKNKTIKNVTSEYNLCKSLSAIYERYYYDE